MLTDNQSEIDALLKRALTILGLEAMEELLASPPRFSAWSRTLDRAVKTQGSPKAVTDEQIIGAAKIAYNVWPDAAENLRSALKDGQSAENR